MRSTGNYENSEFEFGEALAGSNLYGHVVYGMTEASWKEAKMYSGRVRKLADRLKSWMKSRVTEDMPPLEALFLEMSIDRFNWVLVAEELAEQFGMEIPESRKRP